MSRLLLALALAAFMASPATHRPAPPAAPVCSTDTDCARFGGDGGPAPAEARP